MMKFSTLRNITENNMRRLVYLYRNILREHRRLPPSMRHLGNTYLRNEFNLHLKAKEHHLEQFFNSWENYLNILKDKKDSFGSNISSSIKRKLSDEQKLKLNDLKIETTKIRQLGNEEINNLQEIRTENETTIVNNNNNNTNNNNLNNLYNIKIEKSSDHKSNN